MGRFHNFFKSNHNSVGFGDNKNYTHSINVGKYVVDMVLNLIHQVYLLKRMKFQYISGFV